MPRRRSKVVVVLAVVICVLCACAPALFGDESEPDQERLTVVLTAYETEGLRPDWLRQILHAYASDEYADLVGSIVLIWNAPDQAPPVDVPAKVTVVRAASNSLNNRRVWPSYLPSTHLRWKPDAIWLHPQMASCARVCRHQLRRRSRQ